MKTMISRVLVSSLFLCLLLVVGLGLQAVKAADCDATYETFGKAFLEKYCTTCHQAAKGGPANDFNDVNVVKKEKAEIMKKVVEKKTMPPTDPKPDAGERAQVKAWLECEYE